MQVRSILAWILGADVGILADLLENDEEILVVDFVVGLVDLKAGQIDMTA